MLVPIFYLFHLPECFCVFFDIYLCGALNFSLIVAFPPTIIAGDVVKVNLVFFLTFSSAFIVPIITMLGEH